MKTQIHMRKTPTGYTIDVAGKFGGGYSKNLSADLPAAAAALRFAIDRYAGTNKEGAEINAPAEVSAEMDRDTESSGPGKGARLSYYASQEALAVIQAEREASGNSQSGAINTLVVAGAKKT